MTDIDFEQKALKLLEVLAKNALYNCDNIKYAASVLESFYDQGRRDEAFRLLDKEKAL